MKLRDVFNRLVFRESKVESPSEKVVEQRKAMDSLFESPIELEDKNSDFLKVEEKNELHIQLEELISSHHLHLNMDVKIATIGDNIVVQQKHPYYSTEKLEFERGEAQRAFETLKEECMLSVYDKKQQEELVQKVIQKSFIGGLERNQEILGMSESPSGDISISIMDLSCGHNQVDLIVYDKDAHIWSVDNGQDFYMQIPTMDKVLEKLEDSISVIIPSVKDLTIFDVIREGENEISVLFLDKEIPIDEFIGDGEIVRSRPSLSEKDFDVTIEVEEKLGITLSEQRSTYLEGSIISTENGKEVENKVIMEIKYLPPVADIYGKYMCNCELGESDLSYLLKPGFFKFEKDVTNQFLKNTEKQQLKLDKKDPLKDKVDDIFQKEDNGVSVNLDSKSSEEKVEKKRKVKSFELEL